MKYKKKELLYTIDLLDRANQSIANCAVHKIESIESTLMECQNAAIEVGTYLETLGERTKPIVKLLEDYCENIYQQSIHLNNESVYRELSEKNHNQLKEIRESINCESVLDRKEVVFLPYKASMWDSLESIWMAAKKDESCDVYVVPVPYYEKNSDGSLETMVYEENEYPEYVPVVDWREYQMEERRPDITFIHNPYDDSNYVTSVHPDFYSREIKKYTDLLVYIPYFVGIDGKVAEYFCTTPGVFNADKVIVESEAVKKLYIEAIRKVEKENNCEGIFGDLEKKILALGSPKLDWICNWNIGKINIPREWKKLIYDKDEKKRKVILYNTTVNALLNNSNAVLEKIEKVLDWFKHENKVVLLWRPHPLVMSAIKSMRPELYNKYIAIVNQYKYEGWGIYDDTANLERAILISDAYYGDRSSVIELYKETGKPVLIQTYDDSRDIDKDERLGTENLLYDDGMIWLTGISDNKLYTYDLSRGKTTLFYTFEDEKEDQEWLFRAISKKDNLLFLIPFSASALYIIDVLTKKVRKREVTELCQSKYIDYCSTKKFSTFAWYENSIFLIGTTYPAIVKYDYVSDTMTYITDWFHEVQKRFTDYKDFIFKKIYVDGKRFFAPCCRSSCVLEFDMETLEYKVHDLDTDVKGFIATCKNKDQFWLIPRIDEKIVCWDPLKEKVEEYVFLKNEAAYMNFYSDLIEADKEHILLLGGGAKDTLLLDTDKKTVEILSERLHNLGPLSYVGYDQSAFYVFSVYFKLLVKIENKKVYFQKIYSPQYCESLEKQTDSCVQKENKINTLEELAGEISSIDINFADKEDRVTCGELIWDYIKSIRIVS